MTNDVGITIQGSLSDTSLDNFGAIGLSGTWSGPFTNEASGVIGDNGTFTGVAVGETNFGVIDIGGQFTIGDLENAGSISLTGTA